MCACVCVCVCKCCVLHWTFFHTRVHKKRYSFSYYDPVFCDLTPPSALGLFRHVTATCFPHMKLKHGPEVNSRHPVDGSIMLCRSIWTNLVSGTVQSPKIGPVFEKQSTWKPNIYIQTHTIYQLLIFEVIQHYEGDVSGKRFSAVGVYSTHQSGVEEKRAGYNFRAAGIAADV